MNRQSKSATAATERYLPWGMLPQQEVAAPYDPKDFENAACLAQSHAQKICILKFDMKFHIRTTCRVYVFAFY